MRPDSRIFVAGHRGLVGSAICRKLAERGMRNLIVRVARSAGSARRARGAAIFSRPEQPEYVFLAAARVGGILANSTRPAEFLHDNLAIETNVIDAAYRARREETCSFSDLPAFIRNSRRSRFAEESLLTGPLEPTNEWYAIAKIAGIKMAQAYRRQYGFPRDLA